MVNIRDIAKAAKVSVSTVSKALNGYIDVSKETRKKIMEIAVKMDYLPNIMASSLITKKTKTIGIFFGDKINSGFDHPFFNDLINSIKDVAGEEGYDILIFANRKKETNSYKTICYERGVDGVILILTGKKRTDTKIYELSESIPTVHIDSFIYKKSLVNFVESDNEKGAMEATEHLVRLGHKKILKLAGDRIANATYERIRGYKKILKKYNLPIEERLIKYGEFSREKAEEITLEFFKKKEDVTAIFASSDMMAFGAIEALKELGYRVPEDIAVVGFDDIEAAKLYNPALTTIHQQGYKMGEEAARMLINIIRDESNNKTPVNIRIPVWLIVRESCGARLGADV
jgi:LacI family transcriptional regulator